MLCQFNLGPLGSIWFGVDFRVYAPPAAAPALAKARDLEETSAVLTRDELGQVEISGMNESLAQV